MNIHGGHSANTVRNFSATGPGRGRQKKADKQRKTSAGDPRGETRGSAHTGTAATTGTESGDKRTPERVARTSAAFSGRGVGLVRSISKPTLRKMCFRFNNRKNPYLFRDTILKLIASPNLEYKNLTAKVQDAA